MFLKHQPCVPSITWQGNFMVKAEIQFDSINTLDILVCHLLPDQKFMLPEQICEVETLQNTIKNDFNPNTILIGDMNFAGSFMSNQNQLRHDQMLLSDYYIQLLNESGLYYLDSQDTIRGPKSPDQIWAPKKLYNKSLVFDNDNIYKIFGSTYKQIFNEASDHYPVFAHFAFE